MALKAPRRSFAGGALCSVLVFLGLGCSPSVEPSSSGPSAVEEQALEVWFDGCASVVADAGRPTTCVLRQKATLRLWLRAPADIDIEPALAGRPLPVEAEPSASGLLYRLEGLTAGRLSVRSGGKGGGVSEWQLELAAADLPQELYDARSKQRKDPAAARALVEALSAESPSPIVRSHSLALLGRIDRAEQRYDRAEEHFQQALKGFSEADLVSDVIDTQTMLFALRYYSQGNSRGAWEALQGLPEVPAGDTGSAYLSAYYRGVWALRTGDFRSAARWLDVALHHAERFQRHKRAYFVRQIQAPLLSRLGRYQEAVDLLTRRSSGYVSPEACKSGQLEHNIAWNQLLAWEANGGPEGARRRGLDAVAMFDPVAHLLRAQEHFVDPRCEIDDRINTQFDLGLAYFHVGDTRRAMESLRLAADQGARPKAWHRVWSLDLRGRIALKEARPRDALRYYDSLLELGRALRYPDAEWRAELGRARVLAATGRRDAALAAYGRADGLVEHQILTVPIGAERETSLQARAVGTRERIEMLLAADRPTDAYAVAYRAHARQLRGLMESARIESLGIEQRLQWATILDRLFELDGSESFDWTLSADRLADSVGARRRERRVLLDKARVLLGDGVPTGVDPGSPPTGETVLLFYPVPEGWIGFARSQRGCVARLIERPRNEHFGAELLVEPFAEVLSTARRVRVIAGGTLSAVDFHALDVYGEPLLAKMPVIYGLDLPPRRVGRRRDGDTAGTFLLIVDPRGDLVDGPREGDLVEHRIARHAAPRRLVRLDREAATLTAVRKALSNAEVLHFAGHADFSGRAGWDSGLGLAGRSRLTIPSLLAVPSVPRVVVLSACEGAASMDGVDTGLSVAGAFVLAGSEAVVGASRPVSDAESRAFSEAFYRHWDGVSPIAEAVRRAQLELRGAGLEWRSFRVVAR